MEYHISYSDEENPTTFSRRDIRDFLYEHLEEYGDSKEAIEKCISFAYGDEHGQDGFIVIAHEDDDIAGIVIINDTNMSLYIPEHFLVYIAVNKKYRRRGIGQKMIEIVNENTEGDIALHVEPDNPAKELYEKMGFTNKYLEMRLTK
ncbi:MAG TPA: GNAT family N-acetyltransferase [Balneolaceae bacterium]|nr:GNAT family N-acetyltransferase [Balneolaceae bacterium]